MPSWSGSGSESEWSSASSSPAPIQSNLESFLHSVTPLVPTKPLSLKSSDEASGNHDESSMEYYFVLEDVWQCYDEWSAYGVGTPVVLNNYNMSSRRSSSSHGRHDHQTTVVQYYAPYLSAIQLYTNVVMSWPETTTTGTATSNSSNNNMDDNIVQVQEPAAAPRELRNPVAYPYFQYCETISPYWRLPLVDKIAELAADGFPGLISLKSIDLSPASWMSVAW
ncbi:UNVERIFIED_CONTAM: hypothetical protein Sangu_2028600 [Sesamum angustifolium]|uniref:Uncharacterized protein n=1 Tax=Sesamum angustifolium TaxID=2727405 RepID=A0AAW2LHU7_9LAMI